MPLLYSCSLVCQQFVIKKKQKFVTAKMTARPAPLPKWQAEACQSGGTVIWHPPRQFAILDAIAPRIPGKDSAKRIPYPERG